MNKFKIFLNFVIITVLFFITNLPVLAADLNIDCPVPPTTCSKTGVDPLFSSTDDGYWYPGRNLTKTINLKNSSSEKREMAIKGERTSGVSILENVMHIIIIGGTTVIWNGSIKDFYGQDKIGMGIFDPGVNFDYDFTVSMSSGADDNYQNKETVFDLTLGFWGEPAPVATPTPTPGAVLEAGISVGAPTVASGFLLGVLGEATPSGELGPALATEEGEVAGVETEPRNWWILILIGLVGIAGGFVLYFRFFRKK